MTEAIQTTALTSLHIENGARMVPFAGYSMPVQYPDGVLKEHLHTRAKAGLFDVSHMGQALVSGEDAGAALEKLIPIDILDLPVGEQRYGFFTNANGGIEDDLMVSRWPEGLMVVVNAACKDNDFAYLAANMSGDAELSILQDLALIALQGPAAKDVLFRLGHDLSDMGFMQCREIEIKGISCRMSRSGYTGEDGFEISVNNQQAQALARILQADPDCAWIGLGARDSLRLEGGMCLYGHDIDTTTTPIEAAIGWAISPARRSGGLREGGFVGADIILPQMPANISRKRVGLKPQGKAPIREGTEIFDQLENPIGAVTSGGFSPSLGQPIAMGYINKQNAKLGTTVYAMVRGKLLEIEVSTSVFVTNNFYRL
ncbi:MAG: glycine cleavage system aminomethyltransferase GcvT [Proteobacteria bacterium]|nr:glycine cleavage system aminomethyltransferase GcvT [Pseudomonadota bacterium]